ncbi:MAG: Photosynthetic apparatus regulatory protein RegA [Verrucomicrobiota bacterium]
MTKHILTIDDESVIRDLLREVLTAAGYRVTGVSSAAEAMDAVRASRPDLIITDLQLEESDGFEIIDQLAAVAPSVPIILLTGMLFDHETLNRIVGNKIAAYLEKTASLETIISEVKRLAGA